MESTETTVKYEIAEGPDGLWTVLNHLLEKHQQNKHPGPDEYYVLYQLGNQKTMIKVDLGANPVQFWYYDLLGRPATKGIKDTIAKFLWEKCGEKERYNPETGG